MIDSVAKKHKSSYGVPGTVVSDSEGSTVQVVKVIEELEES